MEKELWRAVEENPDYQVSNLGNVKKRVYIKGESTPRYKEFSKGKKNNYKFIVFRDEKGQQHKYHVQKLVLKAFGEFDPKKRIVHLDGDKSNNAIQNLIQRSYKESAEKAKTLTGLHQSNYILVKCDIKTHEEIKEYNYYSDAAREILKSQGLAITRKNITQIVNNLRYTISHKKGVPIKYNYYWKKKGRVYIEEESQTLRREEEKAKTLREGTLESD